MSSRVAKKDQRALESLWPLKVGKEVRFATKIRNQGTVGDGEVGRVSSYARVESSGSQTLGGLERRTFVITILSKLRIISPGGVDQSEYLRRLWYAPEVGMVIKEEFTFSEGAFKGQRYDSTLLSAQLKDGTSLLNLASEIPPAVAASVESKSLAVSVAPVSIEDRLQSVQDLLEEGLITKEEAAEKRQEILDDL